MTPWYSIYQSTLFDVIVFYIDQGFVKWQRIPCFFARLLCCQIYKKSLKCGSTRISDDIEVLFAVADLFNTKMLEEIILFLNQVIAFFQLIGDEDGDADVVREFLARRNYVFDEFLQHQRRARQRINANREVFFTTYVGTWFERYPEVQFKNDFRLSKLAFQVGWNTKLLTLSNIFHYIELRFQNLMNVVGPVIRRNNNLYTGIPVTDKMLMTLWCLANRESFRVLSRRFGLNRGNVHYIVLKTCRQISTIANVFIRWPTRDQYEPLSEENNLAHTIGTK